ncbi:hypothetical protein LGN24_07300 [Burkholderia seminalis]|uniref:hypothetical protein n=1 Tax=Burkholderia seminalis TaxID=488731 RepID=UPI001CF45A4C|nr:hypothetical protein [Burkholderia seminalis]MCA8301288.1 hypothetical protein [Burkholderia seminalis]
MPFAAAVGGLASGIGGSLVSGLLSPSTSGGSGSYYVPTGLPDADQNWQNLLHIIANQYGNNPLQQYGLQSLNAGLAANDQYGGGYQNAANAAGGTYAGLGSLLNQQANSNFATQAGLLQAGQNVYNMGLDPQNALYDRTLNQLTQQTGATNSMYGLGSSAAGAGVQNQALSNFNIDWQNNLLQRATQGLQAYSGAAGTAGRFGELAGQQAAAAPGYALMSGQLPYQTAQMIAGMPGNLANTYGSFLNSNVYGPAEGMMNSIIQYMNNGNGAQAVPFQSQAQGAGAAGSMVSQGISNALGNYFNQPSYTGNFSTSSPFSTSGFYDPVTFGPAGYGGGYSYGGGNSYGFTMG